MVLYVHTYYNVFPLAMQGVNTTDNYILLGYIYSYHLFICLAKPVITAQPTSSRLRVGSENTPLRVSANGTGPIYYHWEKYQPLNDSWIDLAHRVVNISSSELKFKKVSEEDEGIYHCVITSDDGSVISDNATIIVYGTYIN